MARRGGIGADEVARTSSGSDAGNAVPHVPHANVPYTTSAASYDAGRLGRSAAAAGAAPVFGDGDGELGGNDDKNWSPTGKCRRSRTHFEGWQLNRLVSAFQRNTYPSHNAVSTIANATKLSAKTVRVWFQNRRCIEKKQTYPYLPEWAVEANSKYNVRASYQRSGGMSPQAVVSYTSPRTAWRKRPPQIPLESCEHGGNQVQLGAGHPAQTMVNAPEHDDWPGTPVLQASTVASLADNVGSTRQHTQLARYTGMQGSVDEQLDDEESTDCRIRNTKSRFASLLDGVFPDGLPFDSQADRQLQQDCPLEKETRPTPVLRNADVIFQTLLRLDPSFLRKLWDKKYPTLSGISQTSGQTMGTLQDASSIEGRLLLQPEGKTSMNMAGPNAENMPSLTSWRRL